MNFLERFENTEVKDQPKYDKLPEGEYIATVSNVEIKEEAFPEAMRISVEFTVSEGEHTGRKCWFNTKLSDETSDKAMAFIKTTVCKLANVKTTGGDLPGTLNNAIGNTVNISLSYKPGIKDPTKSYSQIFVN